MAKPSLKKKQKKSETHIKPLENTQKHPPNPYENDLFTGFNCTEVTTQKQLQHKRPPSLPHPAGGAQFVVIFSGFWLFFVFFGVFFDDLVICNDFFERCWVFYSFARFFFFFFFFGGGGAVLVISREQLYI